MPAKCEGTLKNGKRCRFNAVDGGRYCRRHEPPAESPAVPSSPTAQAGKLDADGSPVGGETTHTPESRREEGGSLKRFFSDHPSVAAIGVIGAIASILSLFLGIYLGGKSHPELTYYVSRSRIPIVDAEEASRLKVLFDNREITDDVTGVLVQVWNAGDSAIRPDDMLAPDGAPGTLTITLEGNARVLTVADEWKSREEIGLVIDRSRIEEGIIDVNWQILEHNDGVTLKIIYVGDGHVAVAAEATIVDQGKIAEIDSKWTIPVGQGFLPGLMHFLLRAFYLLPVIWCGWRSTVAARASVVLVRRGHRWRGILCLGVVLIYLAAACGMLWLQFRFRSVPPMRI